ncbi:hypothetical protein JL722_7267 [Aureococcus anophagefferens]|nr:hypothetical protein JL722_7267 [Aureococcus anophagefferens]
MMGSSWLLMGLALAGAQNSTCPGDLVWNDCGTLCENTCGAEAATFCSFVCVAACQCPPHLPWRHDAASNSCYADADSCPAATVVGADEDEHGCVASAGYRWCEPGTRRSATATPRPRRRRARATRLGGDHDDHGCIASAGYAWCDGLGARPLVETPCVAATEAPTAGPGHTPRRRPRRPRLHRERGLFLRRLRPPLGAAAAAADGDADDDDDVAGAMMGVVAIVLVLLVGILGGLFAVRRNQRACQSPEKDMLVVGRAPPPPGDLQADDKLKWTENPGTDLAAVDEDVRGIAVV